MDVLDFEELLVIVCTQRMNLEMTCQFSSMRYYFSGFRWLGRSAISHWVDQFVLTENVPTHLLDGQNKRSFMEQWKMTLTSPQAGANFLKFLNLSAKSWLDTTFLALHLLSLQNHWQAKLILEILCLIFQESFYTELLTPKCANSHPWINYWFQFCVGYMILLIVKKESPWEGVTYKLDDFKLVWWEYFVIILCRCHASNLDSHVKLLDPQATKNMTNLWSCFHGAKGFVSAATTW